MKPRTILIHVLFLLLFSLFILAPEEQYTEEEFNQQLSGAGIDPTIISGCIAGCFFDSSSGTLSLVPGAVMTTVPEGMTVLLNGATLYTPAATIMGIGTYTAGDPPSLNGGIIEFDPSLKQTNMIFTDTELQPVAGGIIKGSGRIERGKIILDDGDITFGQISTHVAQVDILKISLRGPMEPNEILLIAKEGFKIGTENDFITVDHFPTLVSLLESDQESEVEILGRIKDIDLPYGTYPDPPTIIVQGKPTVRIADHSDLFYERDIEAQQGEPRPLFLRINGKDHTFLGTLHLESGKVILPAEKIAPEKMLAAIEKEESSPYRARMIDGIYFRPWSDVSVYFDDQIHADRNYAAFGEKLRLHGDDYLAAMSERRAGAYMEKGPLAGLFPHQFEENRYVVKTEPEPAPYRLIFEFIRSSPEQGRGGEVVIDPQQQVLEVAGDVNIVNGPNRLSYSREGENQEYDYQYVGCGSASGTEVICSEVGYSFHDGGQVNVVTEKNTVLLDRGKEPFVLPLGENQELLQAELEKDHLYVLAYKGGEFPKEFVGEKLEAEEWGHVGLLYHKDGQWWVAESTGKSVAISPFSASLFQNGADGIWEVYDDRGNPLRPEGPIRMAEKLVGADYSENPFASNAFSCVELVCKTLKAGGVDAGTTVDFEDLPSDKLSSYAKIYRFFSPVVPGTRIPRELVEDEKHLKPVPTQGPIVTAENN